MIPNPIRKLKVLIINLRASEPWIQTLFNLSGIKTAWVATSTIREVGVHISYYSQLPHNRFKIDHALFYWRWFDWFQIYHNFDSLWGFKPSQLWKILIVPKITILSLFTLKVSCLYVKRLCADSYWKMKNSLSNWRRCKISSQTEIVIGVRVYSVYWEPRDRQSLFNFGLLI